MFCRDIYGYEINQLNFKEPEPSENSLCDNLETILHKPQSF
jgi:hypothetical protein